MHAFGLKNALLTTILCVFIIPFNQNFTYSLSGAIDDGPLRFRGEVYHGYHFNCASCSVELDSSAREVKSRPGFAANDMVI